MNRYIHWKNNATTNLIPICSHHVIYYARCGDMAGASSEVLGWVNCKQPSPECEGFLVCRMSFSETCSSFPHVKVCVPAMGGNLYGLLFDNTLSFLLS